MFVLKKKNQLSHFLLKYYRTKVMGLASSFVSFNGDLIAIMQHKRSIKSQSKSKYIDFGGVVVAIKP